ncbi:MAG: hypothetical protein AVDCRST_MAG90-2751, partial [uncultured Microvirga sp.]
PRRLRRVGLRSLRHRLGGAPAPRRRGGRASAARSRSEVRRRHPPSGPGLAALAPARMAYPPRSPAGGRGQNLSVVQRARRPGPPRSSPVRARACADRPRPESPSPHPARHPGRSLSPQRGGPAGGDREFRRVRGRYEAPRRGDGGGLRGGLSGYAAAREPGSSVRAGPRRGCRDTVARARSVRRGRLLGLARAQGL